MTLQFRFVFNKNEQFTDRILGIFGVSLKYSSRKVGNIFYISWL